MKAASWSTTKSLRWSRPVLRGNRNPLTTTGCRRTLIDLGNVKNGRGTTRFAKPSNTTYTRTPRSAASIRARLKSWPMASDFQMKVSKKISSLAWRMAPSMSA